MTSTPEVYPEWKVFDIRGQMTYPHALFQTYEEAKEYGDAKLGTHAYITIYPWSCPSKISGTKRK